MIEKGGVSNNRLKNWLFCDTPAGACASAIVYTVIETAKANGLDPEGYLNHLLSVLPDHFFRKTLGIQFSMDSLMPWSEKIQKLFAKK